MKDKKNFNNRWSLIIAVFLLLWVLGVLVLSAVPPVSRDALTHHLAVPKLWLKTGGMTEIPTVAFSYYPMNIDLLYLIPLYFGNDIIPKYIHFAFALLTAWLIFGFLKSRTSQTHYGLLGVLLYLSLPIILKLSITVYVDLGLVFFSTAALLHIFKWFAHGSQTRHLLVAGLFCGLSLGTKYNGLISLLLLTCMIPVLYIRTCLHTNDACGALFGEDHREKNSVLVVSWRALQATALFVLISLLVYSPWMIRNFSWTGNPIYPLYHKMLHGTHQASAQVGATAGLTANHNFESAQSRLGHFALRKRVFNETFLELITTPVRIFFQGEDDNPKYFDGQLNPYLLLFPFLIVIGFKQLPQQQKRENIALLGFSSLFLIFTFLQIDMRIRYIAPIIPPLVLLSVIGLYQTETWIRHNWTGVRQRAGCGLLVATVIGLLFINVGYFVKQFRVVDPIGYLSGKIERDVYITKYRKEYPAIQFVNRQLPEDTRLLAIYLGNRIYYSDREMVSNDVLFKKSIAESTTADALADNLQQLKFTHLLIRLDYFKQFIFDHLSKEKRSLVNNFFKTQSKKLFSKGVYYVYEIANTRHASSQENRITQKNNSCSENF